MHCLHYSWGFAGCLQDSYNIRIYFCRKNGINMIRICFILVFSFCILTAGGQQMSHDLSYYAEAARNYSPLLHDYRNQLQIKQAELRRLKALYTRLRLELNGDYLFVPVLTKDGGTTSFRWNAQDATDYYGYDLGESSGHLLLVVLPALMRRIYR